MDAAVAAALAEAEDGDTVLLAPACASFDQYDSFEHRGAHFTDLVHSRIEAGGGTP
jgi:UDP-N-acetylmuramoylalanine--D-glutamate ligase